MSIYRTDDDDSNKVVDLKNIPPDKLIQWENNTERTIILKTTEFADSLLFCENVVKASYEVANYTPLFGNDQQEKFWKEQV